MKIKILILALFVLLIPLSSKNAAGYNLLTQSVKADVDVSYDRAYDASLEGIRFIGGLSIDKKSEGWIKTEVKQYSVDVNLVKLPDNKVQINVSASKPGYSQPQYAQEVLSEILKRVKDQSLWMH